MGLAVGCVEEVLHGNAPGEEAVGDEPTVAAPGHGFRAEKNEPDLPNLLLQPIQCQRKLRSLHRVGKAAEARIPPCLVFGIPFGVAQTSQGSHMRISNIVSCQRSRKGLFVELRIVSRTWNGSDVDDTLNLFGLQNPKKLLQGPSAVSKGKDGRVGWESLRAFPLHGER
ncbi:hypothetical protein MAMC_00621 [Methylacidimicrobium cyclopophantes]|uniref:Uncharacterized protein n=1 Tax=Methylacidimicrobium cyclopophantes TaxID=1041766 RepID=A0A5E6MAZ2_9BACT|nr:hypothetical protein MAMC_00621 [Methylacidimicrobium cyclopophantes]